MKYLIKLTLALVTLALPLQALESRTFHDASKSKSFQATLTGYDANKKLVTVVNTSGKTMSFGLSIISEDCQKYVLSKSDLLAVSKNVRLKFNEAKEKQANDTVATGYTIEVYNRGKNSVENITLNYTLYYDEGNLVKGGFVSKIKEGSVDTGKIYNGDTLSVDSSKVYLVRKIVAPVGGG